MINISIVKKIIRIDRVKKAKVFILTGLFGIFILYPHNLGMRITDFALLNLIFSCLACSCISVGFLLLCLESLQEKDWRRRCVGLGFCGYFGLVFADTVMGLICEHFFLTLPTLYLWYAIPCGIIFLGGLIFWLGDA